MRYEIIETGRAVEGHRSPRRWREVVSRSGLLCRTYGAWGFVNFDSTNMALEEFDSALAIQLCFDDDVVKFWECAERVLGAPEKGTDVAPIEKHVFCGGCKKYGNKITAAGIVFR